MQLATLGFVVGLVVAGGCTVVNNPVQPVVVVPKPPFKPFPVKGAVKTDAQNPVGPTVSQPAGFHSSSPR